MGTFDMFYIEQRKIAHKITELKTNDRAKKLRSREVGCSHYGLIQGLEHTNTVYSRRRTVSVLSCDHRPFSQCKIVLKKKWLDSMRFYVNFR